MGLEALVMNVVPMIFDFVCFVFGFWLLSR
jgi:hypothetical protein